MEPIPVGKLPADLLEDLLRRYVGPDPRMIVGPGIGCDAAVLDLGDRYLVAPIEGTPSSRQVTFQLGGGDSRELPGSHRLLKGAFAAAHEDNQTRLRWLGDPDATVQLDSTGRYQMSRCVSGLWAPGYIGGLDDDGEAFFLPCHEMWPSAINCDTPGTLPR